MKLALGLAAVGLLVNAWSLLQPSIVPAEAHAAKPRCALRSPLKRPLSTGAHHAAFIR